VQFKSTIDQILFSQNPSHVQLGLSAQIAPSSKHPAVPNHTRGSIGHGVVTPNLTLQPNQTFGLSISDDVINQALWAFWQGGGLHIPNLVEMLQNTPMASGLVQQLGNARIATQALLPPVLMPGNSASKVSIGLGDFLIDAQMDLGPFITPPSQETNNTPVSLPVHVVAYLNTIAEAEISLDALTNQLSVRLLNTPEVRIEIIDTDIPGQRSVLGPVLNQVFTVVLPHMLENAFKTIPVPSFDIGKQLGLQQPVIWTLRNASLQHDNSRFQTMVFGDVRQ
jgi:hypothetical protein